MDSTNLPEGEGVRSYLRPSHVLPLGDELLVVRVSGTRWFLVCTRHPVHHPQTAPKGQHRRLRTSGHYGTRNSNPGLLHHSSWEGLIDYIHSGVSLAVCRWGAETYPVWCTRGRGDWLSRDWTGGGRGGRWCWCAPIELADVAGPMGTRLVIRPMCS